MPAGAGRPRPRPREDHRIRDPQGEPALARPALSGGEDGRWDHRPRRRHAGRPRGCGGERAALAGGELCGARPRGHRGTLGPHLLPAFALAQRPAGHDGALGAGYRAVGHRRQTARHAGIPASRRAARAGAAGLPHALGRCAHGRPAHAGEFRGAGPANARQGVDGREVVAAQGRQRKGARGTVGERDRGGARGDRRFHGPGAGSERDLHGALGRGNFRGSGSLQAAMDRGADPA